MREIIATQAAAGASRAGGTLNASLKARPYMYLPTKALAPWRTFIRIN